MTATLPRPSRRRKTACLGGRVVGEPLCAKRTVRKINRFEKLRRRGRKPNPDQKKGKGGAECGFRQEGESSRPILLFILPWKGGGGRGG